MADLLTAPLPSPSVLTGNYRPQAATAFVEQAAAYAEAKARALAGSRLGTPSTPKGSGVSNPEEVHSLRHAVSRHLELMQRAPRTPYPFARAASTPPSRGSSLPAHMSHGSDAPASTSYAASLASPMSSRPGSVQGRFGALLPPGCARQPPHAEASATWHPGSQGGPQGPDASLVLPDPPRLGPPPRPRQLRFAPEYILSRQATPQVSVQDVALTRPVNRAGRGIACAEQGGVAASWAGPLTGTEPPGSGGAAAGGSAQGGGSSQPGTPLLRHREPAPLTPSLHGAVSHVGQVGRAGYSGPVGFHHTLTKRLLESATGPGGGSSSALLEAVRQRGGLRVSRGMMYSVFQELDEFDTGHLTYSAFEQAACKVGMRPQQARRLFGQLDPAGRGYATMHEWGSPVLEKQLQAFTRAYVQNTRCENGRPKGITEIRSIHMAIQLALHKLQLKRCGRSISMERLVEAFAFIDADRSGCLSAAELEDALNALGIFVTPEVIETVMKTFDRDESGGVDYYEFVKALYPNQAVQVALRGR